MAAIVTVVILLPIVLYLIVALREPMREQTPGEFFWAEESISASAFANTSIAYGFQIASVSVFFAWGYLYGFGAIVNPVFWGIGILFFLGFIARITATLDKGTTLHGFLGTTYDSPFLTILASIMTVIGFVGAFTAEIVWGSVVFSTVFDSALFISFTMIIMAGIILFYTVRAGQTSVILTDQYQLLFAQLSFVSLVLYLLWRLYDSGQTSVSLLLGPILAILFGACSFYIYRQLRFEGISFRLDGPIHTLILFVLMSTGLLSSLIISALSLGSAADVPELFNDSSLADFGSQGVLNLLSLSLLPLCWQYVDFTMWQRLSAVRSEGKTKSIRAGLIRYAVESPVSWLLAVVIGIALRYLQLGVNEDNVWNGISSIPLSLITESSEGAYLALIVAGLFGAGITAAMLSSADTFLFGSSTTFVYDVLPRVFKKPDWVTTHPDRAVLAGRATAIVLMVSGISIYFLATFFGFDVLSILFGAFGAQLSLFPSVIGAIILPNRLRASARFAVASVLLGALFGFGATLVALTGQSDWQLYPPLFVLATSVPVYGLGVLLKLSEK